MANKAQQETSYWELFNNQITRLRDRGIQEEIIEILLFQKSSVIKKAREMVIGKGNIPFLPIITPFYLGYYGLMSKVGNGGYIPFPSIAEETKYYTTEASLNGPRLYYIYDVETGEETLDKSPKEAQKIFNDNEWIPLTTVEVINLCIIVDVLPRHSVCAGSGLGLSTTAVCLDDSRTPSLQVLNSERKDHYLGSPSCGSRG